MENRKLCKFLSVLIFIDGKVVVDVWQHFSFEYILEWNKGAFTQVCEAFENLPFYAENVENLMKKIVFILSHYFNNTTKFFNLTRINS